ncbi:MAG: hypothetical protein GW917_02800 [Bdellovibrionales bacterium]|nr:hypothetical protein [Bdellovibrionales bacterium]
MIRLLKALILFLSFSAEVHVRAEAFTVIEGCSSKDIGYSLECVVRNTTSKVQVKKLPHLLVFAQKKSTFSASPNLIHWIYGEGGIKASGLINIKTNFGTALCEGVCFASYKKNSKELEFHALKGSWQILSFGDREHISLSAGESVKGGRVGDDGSADWSLPYSMTQDHLTYVLEDLFGRQVSAAEKAAVKKAWQRKVEGLSEHYKVQVTRQVASHKEKLAKKKQAELHRKKEDEELRKLFREKTLLD